MGVFRIARAEFIKIFKKPSVYLMGVILAAVLVLSLLFFEPIGKQNYTVNLDGTTVGKIYDKFTAESTSELKKSSFDKVIDDSLNKVNFYIELNERNSSLEQVNNEFIVLYNDLVVQSKIENNDQKINDAFATVKNKLESYNEIYNNISTLKDNSKFYNHFTTLPIFTEAKETLSNLTSKAQHSSTTPKIFLNYVESNEYISKLEKVYDTNKNFIDSTLDYYANNIKTKQNEYYNRVINNPTSSQETFGPLRTALYNEISSFYDVLITLAESENTLAFLSKEEYESLKNNIAEAKSLIESYTSEALASKTDYQRHKHVVSEVQKLSLFNKIVSFKENIADYSVSTTTLKNLQTTISTNINNLKVGLNSSIESLYKQNPVSSATNDVNKINDLITSYRVLSINSTNLVNDTINLETTSSLKSTQINQYIGFEDFNSYETRENLTRTTYFIDNSEYNHHFSDVFAFNKNSTTETSAYDFMFYGMEIATLVITIFAIFLAASLMASEYDSGTIKLLAMRPFKRWKIITGKLFATMIFSIIFILFSFLICFVAGICMFPLTNMPALMVFNATTAFSVHPLILMLLDVLCIILEVLFYAVIALSVSTVFRSFTSAISISCIMFILAVSMNVLFGGFFWYSFIPFINADFFKFFGGTFLTTEASALNSLFIPTLLSNANLFISLGIFAGTILVFLLITYISFKLRDF